MIRSFSSLALTFRRRIILLFLLIGPVWPQARAAEIDGVALPDSLQVAGKTLLLNGAGLRTFSFLGVHVYVAALYLEHPSHDPEAILRSPETKLLTVIFIRDVSADAAKKAWREGLANNCRVPCDLDPGDVEKFIAGVPAMHAGDTFSEIFTPRGADVILNGHQIGVVSRPRFAETMLATFLGPRPASPELKQALLNGHT